jgi:hypothetical protein
LQLSESTLLWIKAVARLIDVIALNKGIAGLLQVLSLCPLFNHSRNTPMKKLAILGSCVLAIMLAGTQAASAREISAETDGTCKLTNVRVGKVIYHGDCRIKQTIKRDTTVWDIKMGNADSMLFAGRGTHYMHGGEDVTFSDRGNTGIFAWGDFTLKVTQD